MKIRCPNCNQKLEIDDDLLGLTLECPCCNNKFEAKVPVAVAEANVTQDVPSSEKLVKCENCGNKIAKSSHKCVHCGGKKELHPAIVCGALVLTFWCIVGYGCHMRKMDQQRYEVELRKANSESLDEALEENRKKREEEKKLLRQLEIINNK